VGTVFSAPVSAECVWPNTPRYTHPRNRVPDILLAAPSVMICICRRSCCCREALRVCWAEALPPSEGKVRHVAE